MRKSKKHSQLKTAPKGKKGQQKMMNEKQTAWKSFWDRYCQM